MAFPDLTKHLKEGDKVWTIQYGWVLVESVDDENGFIEVLDGKFYDFQGKLHATDSYPSLFLKEQTFDFSIPEPTFEKDELVWASFDELHSFWVPAYYALKAEDGVHHVGEVQKKPSSGAFLTSATAVRKWSDSPFKAEK